MMSSPCILLLLSLNFITYSLNLFIYFESMINCLRVCKYYARGTCLKGEQCCYSHESKEASANVGDSSSLKHRLLTNGSICNFFCSHFLVSSLENRFADFIRKDTVLMVVDAGISMSKHIRHKHQHHLQQMDPNLWFQILARLIVLRENQVGFQRLQKCCLQLTKMVGVYIISISIVKGMVVKLVNLVALLCHLSICSVHLMLPVAPQAISVPAFMDSSAYTAESHACIQLIESRGRST